MPSSLGAKFRPISWQGSYLASSWTPAKINPFAWWKASTSLATYGNGNPVPSWADLGSGNSPLTESASGQQPLVVANVINRQPVVRFDGVDDQLSFATALSTTAWISQPVQYFVLVSVAAVHLRRFLSSLNTAVGRNLIYAQTGNSIIFAGSNVDSGVPIGTGFHLWGCVFHGALSTISIDGTQVAAGDANTLGQVGGVVVGAEDGDYAQCDIAEIVVTTPLSTPNLALMNAYFQSKYGL